MSRLEPVLAAGGGQMYRLTVGRSRLRVGQTRSSKSALDGSHQKLNSVGACCVMGYRFALGMGVIPGVLAAVVVGVAPAGRRLQDIRPT